MPSPNPDPLPMPPPAPCVVCREVAQVDSEGWCYPCFEDAMFAEDSDMADMGVDA